MSHADADATPPSPAPAPSPSLSPSSPVPSPSPVVPCPLGAARPETLAVHPPHVEITGSRPLGVPLHQGHVFAFDSADALATAFTSTDAFLYSRLGNPTVRTLEDAVARLEGGTADSPSPPAWAP